MKDSRIGESLWLEWIGDGLSVDSLCYFTESHVDTDHELVVRALASALQRDGIVVTLGEGYRAVERAGFSYTYAGYVDGEYDFTICDADGMTENGDIVDDVVEVTLAELSWLV